MCRCEIGYCNPEVYADQYDLVSVKLANTSRCTSFGRVVEQGTRGMYFTDELKSKFSGIKLPERHSCIYLIQTRIIFE